MRMGVARDDGGAEAVRHPDELLDNELWVAEQLPALIEAGVQARESGLQWKRNVAQTVRHTYPKLSKSGKAKLRRRVYEEMRTAVSPDSPGWARGSAFDEHRARRRKLSEGSRRGHREAKERGTALRHKPTRASAYVDEARGVPLASSALTEPVRVVVEGPWGRLAMAIDVAADGTVEVRGRVAEQWALGWLQGLMDIEGSRLVTNRLR